MSDPLEPIPMVQAGDPKNKSVTYRKSVAKILEQSGYAPDGSEGGAFAKKSDHDATVAGLSAEAAARADGDEQTLAAALDAIEGLNATTLDVALAGAAELDAALHTSLAGALATGDAATLASAQGYADAALTGVLASATSAATSAATAAAAGQVSTEAAARLLSDGSLDTRITANASALTALQAGQVAVFLGYATKALLDADLAKADGTLALVTNDSTPTNNTTYRKSGASGAGSWVVSVDRVTQINTDLSGLRAAGLPVDATKLEGYEYAMLDGADKAAFGVKTDGTVDIARLSAATATVAALTATAVTTGGADTVAETDTPELLWSVKDQAGNVALGVQADGTVIAAGLATAGQAVPTDLSLNTLTVGGAVSQTEAAIPDLLWAVEDESGRVALGVRTDGSVIAAGLDASSGDTLDLARHGGTYPAELNYIDCAGQSLAAGSDGLANAITTAQEYDNVGFPAVATSPTTYVPLTVALTQNATGESPLYGTLGHIKALIAAENGLAYTDYDYQLLGCNNGFSGASIDQINKGGSGTRFERALTQVASGKAIADGEGRTFAFAAVTWTQGEADATMSAADYRAKLIQLAADFNTDGKAITGQAGDVQFITYQLGRYTALNGPVQALLEASEQVRYIHCATPIYFMTFYDGTHLVADSSKWLGGYYGLCYKRVVIDGTPWVPLKPVHHAVIGNAVDLQFSKEGLVFDTTLMPAQTNMGFTVVDAVGSPVTIASVAIVGPSRVRITCASAPQAGWRVKYGHINVAGKTNYTDGGGNLRDSAGDRLTYIGHPMHNWCVIFNYEV